MKAKRQSGVLMPVSALPGDFSCGNFGASAYDFIDFLANAGFSWWQVLPICIPDGHRSPYMSPASFAGDVSYVDPESLFREGLLTGEELNSARQKIDYRCEAERLQKERKALLLKAAVRVKSPQSVDAFFETHPELALSCEYLAKKEALPYETALFYHRFTQYQFHRQWFRLKEYAGKRGVSILGDLPFYVSPDSADTQLSPDLFQLDETGHPLAVAGVPPDYFSQEGQLWGNPLYRFDRMEQDGFAWWRARVREALTLFDGVRLDHFRAIDAYWSIPSKAKSAKEGNWVKGPGMKLIRALKEEAKGRLLIAENLGILDKSVDRLLEESGFPGMAVFQFGFDGTYDNPHLPHNYTENTVAYTGTHDNNTLLGFVWEADDKTRKELLSYVGFEGESWDRCYECILRTLLRSPASLVIFPIQDLLGYGADTRFNVPGKAEGNWLFRISHRALASLDADKFYRMNRMYARCNGRK